MNVTPIGSLGYSVLGMAIVFLMLIMLMAVIYIMGKVMTSKKPDAAAPAASPAVVTAAAPAEKPKAPGSAGDIKLYNVPERTAAMLMAVVANQMGVPLNELRFVSIKQVD